MRQLFDIVSNEKSFKHPLIGSPWLNRLGLHSARVLGAGLCSRVRRLGAGAAAAELRTRLWRDGFVVIGNLLPAALVEPARREFEQRLEAHEAEVPRPRVSSGFGRRLQNADGFDRPEGASLNRFVTLDARCPLLHRAFSDNLALRGLLRALVGTTVAPDAFWLNRLVHGDEAAGPDPQRQLHCDSFHDAFELWYCFDPVTPAADPLHYAAGTQRSGGARRRWEKRQILASGARSAAFRVSADDLAGMGSAPPRPVLAPANSLVLINTRGFHQRGAAPPGTVWQGLYVSLLPHAFGLRP